MSKLKRAKRLLIGAGCIALLLISWLIAVNSKSPVDKQMELVRQASALMDDGIYVVAVPLLEEAADYDTVYTIKVEEELKKAYLALIDTRGYRRKYTNLLETQINRTDAQPEVFMEAANYYLGISKIPEALAVLRTGIAKTQDEQLIALYEQNRYVYEINRASYDYAAAIYGKTSQVKTGGLWGLASADGTLLIPCVYEKISTFSADRVIVKKDNEIFAVNIDNNRVAVMRDETADFGNFANDRIPLQIGADWKRATGEFVVGTASFEGLGMYSDGYAAAQTGGMWGVVDLKQNWLIPAEFDGIVMDELGRCYAQGAVFVRKQGLVYLYVEGRLVGDAFDDAKPFSDEGYAAVKRNGRWGFIDTNGQTKISCLYDDALSFGQHLAAVKQNELWGYINLYGDMVIEPVFIEAKSFSNGSAPVYTGNGWQFITLLELKSRQGIM